jgi:hypothetical protein
MGSERCTCNVFVFAFLNDKIVLIDFFPLPGPSCGGEAELKSSISRPEPGRGLIKYLCAKLSVHCSGPQWL